MNDPTLEKIQKHLDKQEFNYPCVLTNNLLSYALDATVILHFAAIPVPASKKFWMLGISFLELNGLAVKRKLYSLEIPFDPEDSEFLLPLTWTLIQATFETPEETLPLDLLRQKLERLL